MAAQLRIGIDARAAAEEPAGRGRYVRELIAHLPGGPRYRLYARRRWESDHDWRLIDAPDPVWHLRAAHSASRECDVFLSTNSYLTAWFTRIPTAIVVMDMIAWLPDMNPQKRAARIEKATIRPALRRAALAICISAATESDLVARFQAVRGRTAVVPLGVPDRLAEPPDVDDVRRRLALPERFVLATGTLEPRKNLPRLIEAHRQLDSAPPLLVAGPKGWELERALAGVDENVRLLGFVSDADLAALYELCTVFAFPSLYEGFGLPVAEAMRSGAACLVSDRGSLPEVGGDAVEYCDPLDVGSIARGLERLLGSDALRAELGARARQQAERFTWERCAAQTVELLERIARA
jgi:glycosyltransferase involved in cell wall biosynthesis